MPADLKSKTLMAPAKRLELWLVYSAVYSFLCLCVFWNLDDRRIADPLVRLIFIGQLVLVYAVIAVLVRQFYDKDGKRIRRQPERPIEPSPDGEAT